MKFNRILAVAVGIAVCASAWADLPFRQHRYDSFKATPTESGQIVFAGNSITNMHSWFEAFGSHQEVIGRGNSGGFAYELLENLESYIDSKPSKLFVMIGTNDVSSGISYQLTARRIEAIARRVRLESPETEVYLQTILPRSSNAKPDYELCNTLVKQFVEEFNDPKVHCIDLSDVCAPLNGNGNWSYDGLHPRPIGYAAWTHHIEDYVGYPSVYPETVSTQVGCGLSGSDAARVEQFPYFPVKEGDVLFFGDEQVHGGEWHELLRCDKIKDRGQKWGWGGIALTNAKQVVASALSDQAAKPAKIFLFYGVGGKDLTNYGLLVDEAKAQAPDAKIYVVSLTPSTNAATDDANIAFNTEIAKIAAAKGATYVDIHTPLSENIAANIMGTNYVSGRGYVVMANELAKYLTEENVNPVSLAEYEEIYAYRNNRKIVGDAITEAMLLEYGNGVGQIKEVYKPVIEAAIVSAVSVITAESGLTADAARAAVAVLSEVVNNAKTDVNLPLVSSAVETYWYTLVSARGSRALTVDGADNKLIGDTAPSGVSFGYDVWKFIDRGDNTYDIVNFHNQYINPAAAFNTQMSVMDERPDRGFSLSYSNYSPGAFTIYTSDSQLNQTSIANAAGNAQKVYNWSTPNAARPDRNDQGCAYTMTLFENPIVDKDDAPVESGWYEITRAADGLRVVNMEESARQNADYSYSLQYVTEAESSPKAWIYLDINGETRYVQALNGYYLGAFVANSTTPYNFSMSASTTVEGAYYVQYWLPFTINGLSNVIGRSSGASHPHYFKKVTDASLAGYDVWTVLVAANAASELVNNTKVTYASDNNKGIATVYNNGKFFVTPGTVISAEDLVVNAPEGVDQDRESPEITIDADSRTIAVALTGNVELPDVPASETLDAGWYTLDLCGYVSTRADIPQWVDAAMAVDSIALFASEVEYEQTLQGNKHYYFIGVGVAANLPAPAQTYFYVRNPTLNTMRIRSLNGHHILTNGTAGRSETDLELALTSKGVATLPLCLWANNNIGSPHNLIGFFNGSKCKFRVTSVDISDYDVYTVSIVGETPAAAIRDDVKVTLDSEANKGLQSVYNGGSFFVTKGARISAEDITVPAHKDNENPKITVADGMITVDYNETQSSIIEVESVTDGNDSVYDFWGRRVASPRHGLYIVNGRKVRL